MAAKGSIARETQGLGALPLEGQRFAAEVRCLHCARLIGTWEWTSGAPQGLGTITPEGGTAHRDLLWRLRCENCGGPAVLAEVEPLREQEEFTWTPMKRGRKPKDRAA